MQVDNSFFLKGDLCWSASLDSLGAVEDAHLLCLEGKLGGVYKTIPENFRHLPVKDHSGKLIIPGLTDLHVHAPQFSFRSLGMDLELLDWLNTHTFPEEAKYRDLGYAREAYGRFIEHVRKGPNTRLCVYATVHSPATLLLADMLEESGLVSFVGKVSMDRNCPANLQEGEASDDTGEWADLFLKGHEEGRYKNTFPILTPRFIPACSDALMEKITLLQGKHGLPVQSHLSENRKEVEWVRELRPQSEHYSGAYADFGLLGGSVPTIMAHCVLLDDRELKLLAENRVYIAHCPQSNINLSSGIAPVRRFLEKSIPVGLGSDVAGGVNTSIFRAMTDAIAVSKLHKIFSSPEPAAPGREAAAEEKPLSIEEAFYLGTAGGGSFFGKLSGSCGPRPSFGPSGSFEEGWDFDALVIEDSSLGSGEKRSIRDRLVQAIYLSDDRQIAEKYAMGRLINKK